VGLLDKFQGQVKAIYRKYFTKPLPLTGDPALDAAVQAGPRLFDPDLPKHLRFEIAKRSAFGAYNDALQCLAQHQVRLMHEQIAIVGRENRTTDWQATRTHIPHARIPQLLWDFFEAIYGQGCWQDNDFMEDVLKHHPELRVKVKRGIRGQEYVHAR
jgi:hypothetical protein